MKGYTEQEFGGDVFDRNVMYACANSTPTSLSFVCNNDAAIDGISYGVAKGCATTNLYVDDNTFNASIETISERLEHLQKQINNLKQQPKAESSLRAALKTLHYPREVK